MSRRAWLGGALVVLAAGASGYWVGHRGLTVDVPALQGVLRPLAGLGRGAAPPEPAATAEGPIVYFRDPDGQPVYSMGPASTADGRAFTPVRQSQDLNFDEPSKTAVQAQGAPKRVLYYRNPMGLPDASPVPKKDSMGMDYIPVLEGDDEGGATVTISPGKLQRTGVRSSRVERRMLRREVHAPGTIQLDERRVSVVALRSEGFIERVENVTTGDRVRKGQPLLRLYSPEISAAAAQYITGIGLEGARRRLENLAIPADAIAEIERTRRAPSTITWLSPRDGVVLERAAIEGMRAASGEPLFRIADTSIVWALADVAENDIAGVTLGQSTSLTLRGMPGRIYSGRVSLIYPQLEKVTRTVRVRIEISNEDGALLPDMYADVTLAAGPSEPVVAVPDGALIDSGARRVVILDKGDGRFEPREVEIGARGDGWIEILAGVTEGDQVVTAANFLIDAESNLKAALTGMAARTEDAR